MCSRYGLSSQAIISARQKIGKYMTSEEDTADNDPLLRLIEG